MRLGGFYWFLDQFDIYLTQADDRMFLTLALMLLVQAHHSSGLIQVLKNISGSTVSVSEALRKCVGGGEKWCQQETHLINLPFKFKSGRPSSSGKGQPEGSPHNKRFSSSPKLPRLFFAGQVISQLLTRTNLEQGLVPTQRELGYVDLCWLLRRLSPTPWDLPGHSPPPMQGKVGKFCNL